MSSKHHTDEVFTQKRRPKGPIKFKVQLNEEQKQAKSLILNSPITTLRGMAGSGKTLVAVQVALDLLFQKKVEKMVEAASTKQVLRKQPKRSSTAKQVELEDAVPEKAKKKAKAQKAKEKPKAPQAESDEEESDEDEDVLSLKKAASLTKAVDDTLEKAKEKPKAPQAELVDQKKAQKEVEASSAKEVDQKKVETKEKPKALQLDQKKVQKVWRPSGKNGNRTGSISSEPV